MYGLKYGNERAEMGEGRRLRQLERQKMSFPGRSDTFQVDLSLRSRARHRNNPRGLLTPRERLEIFKHYFAEMLLYSCRCFQDCDFIGQHGRSPICLSSTYVACRKLLSLRTVLFYLVYWATRIPRTMYSLILSEFANFSNVMHTLFRYIGLRT